MHLVSVILNDIVLPPFLFFLILFTFSISLENFDTESILELTLTLTLLRRIFSEFTQPYMEHILTDPALEAQPNFKSAAYLGLLNALIGGGITREDALE